MLRDRVEGGPAIKNAGKASHWIGTDFESSGGIVSVAAIFGAILNVGGGVVMEVFTANNSIAFGIRRITGIRNSGLGDAN